MSADSVESQAGTEEGLKVERGEIILVDCEVKFSLKAKISSHQIQAKLSFDSLSTLVCLQGLHLYIWFIQ